MVSSWEVPQIPGVRFMGDLELQLSRWSKHVEANHSSRFHLEKYDEKYDEPCFFFFRMSDLRLPFQGGLALDIDGLVLLELESEINMFCCMFLSLGSGDKCRGFFLVVLVETGCQRKIMKRPNAGLLETWINNDKTWPKENKRHQPLLGLRGARCSMAQVSVPQGEFWNWRLAMAQN